MKLSAACTLSIEPPTEATLSCQSDADCPEGFSCSGEAGLCVQPGRPSVTIGVVGRSTSLVEIPLTVFDPDGNDVSLAVALGIGGGFEPISVSPATVRGSPSGNEVRVQWDAAAYFEGDTGLREGLVVRVEPSDADGIGPAVQSQPFAFGNDAPRIEAASVSTVEGVAGGVVGLRVRVSDSASDRVSVTGFAIVPESGPSIEVALDGDDFPDLDALSWVADGVDQVVSWDSAVSGVFTDVEVQLEIEVTDELGAASGVFRTDPFILDNAPVVVLAPIEPMSGVRSVDQVVIAWTSIDPSGAADTVDLSFELSTDDSAVWSPMTPVAFSASTRGLSGERQVGDFIWDVLVDAATGTGGLELNPQTGQVAFAAGVLIRVVATDSTALSRVFEPGAIDLGNDPPAITLDPPAEIVRGDVPIAYRLQDSAEDQAEVEAQFRLNTSDPWRAALLGGGTDRDLPTDVNAPGRAGVYVWDSSAPLDTTPETPQGVGAVASEDIGVRLRACDQPDGLARVCSEWVETLLPTVANQSPPRINDLRILRPFNQGGTGSFAVAFLLEDEEGDDADIRVQISTDLGDTYSDLVEYPAPASEGFYDLAAGVEHVVMVDPGQRLFSEVEAVRVRVLATDGFPEGSPEVSSADVIVARPFGELGPRTAGLGAPAGYSYTGEISYGSASGDFTNDEILDVVVWSVGDTSDVPRGETAMFVGQGSGGVGDGSFVWLGTSSTVGGVPFGGLEAAVGDFDKDDNLDLALPHGSFFKDMGSSGSEELDASVALMFGNGAGGLSVSVRLFELGEARGIVADDIDGNDWLDFVVVPSSFSASFVRVVLGGPPSGGLRENIFAAPVEVPLPGVPSRVDVGQVNDDGVPDLAVALDGGQLGVALGNGDGTCGTTELYSITGAPADLLLADVDDDGLDDLVWIDGKSDLVSVLRTSTRTTGAFGAEVQFNAGEQAPLDVETADMNLDGAVDIVLAFAGEVVGVLLGQLETGRPNGLFSTASLFSARSGVGFETNIASLEVGDYREDGLPDLASVVGGDTVLQVVLSEPELPFLDVFATQSAVDVRGGPRGGGFGDLDGNGVIDFVTGNGGSFGTSRGSLMLGRGVNGVTSGAYVTADEQPTSEFFARDAVSADFNRDGLGDIALSSQLDVTLRLARGVDGDIGVTYPDAQILAVPSSNVLVATDLNEDGWPDLVSGSSDQTPGTLDVFMNRADGTLPTFNPVVSYAIEASHRAIEFADINADGILDAVVLSFAPGLDVLLGQGTNGIGDGTFAPATFYPLAEIGTALALCDVDGDLIVDAVVSNNINDFVVLRGTGAGGVPSGGFESAVTISGASNEGLVCGDFDGDGLADVVAFDDGGTLYRGQANPTEPLVATGVTLPAGTGFEEGFVADLSGDGILDLATIQLSDSEVVLYAGQANRLRSRSSRVLVEGGPAAPYLLPGSITPGTDRFGDSYIPVLATQRAGRAQSLPPRLVSDCSAASGTYVPLTDAWRFEGDLALRRLPGSEVPGGEPRLTVGARTGPVGDPTLRERLGFDLSGGTLAEQRGVVVELPLLATTEALAVGNPVRVVVRAHDWLRADAVPDDPLDDARFLPRQIGEAAGRDFIVPRDRSVEICRDDDSNLDTGTEARFVVSGGAVRILTDTLGVMQAFVRAP